MTSKPNLYFYTIQTSNKHAPSWQQSTRHLSCHMVNGLILWVRFKWERLSHWMRTIKFCLEWARWEAIHAIFLFHIKVNILQFVIIQVVQWQCICFNKIFRKRYDALWLIKEVLLMQRGNQVHIHIAACSHMMTQYCLLLIWALMLFITIQ